MIGFSVSIGFGICHSLFQAKYCNFAKPFTVSDKYLPFEAQLWQSPKADNTDTALGKGNIIWLGFTGGGANEPLSRASN